MRVYSVVILHEAALYPPLDNHYYLVGEQESKSNSPFSQSIFLKVLLTIANPIVNTASKIPLIVKESAVPIFSAKVPNGTALKGIIPKVIMDMLIVRPLISGSALSCTIVMFKDMYIELVKPINIRNGTAMENEVT